MSSPLPPPRYRASHSIFVAFMSLLIAGGSAAALFNVYRQAYTIEISQELTKNISADDVKAALDEHEEVMIIDVREKEEYDSEYIPGSSNIPLGTLWKSYESKELPLTIPIVVYSDDETRGALAASILTKEPILLPDVSELSGGLNAWKAKQYPVYGILHAEYIDPVEVAELLRQGEKILFVDVRSEREYMTLHVKSAISIPIEILPDSLHLLSKTAQLVIIDTPSNEGYGYLDSIGWEDIQVLEGGMERWKELGYAKESNLQAPLSDEESQ